MGPTTSDGGAAVEDFLKPVLIECCGCVCVSLSLCFALVCLFRCWSTAVALVVVVVSLVQCLYRWMTVFGWLSGWMDGWMAEWFWLVGRVNDLVCQWTLNLDYRYLLQPTFTWPIRFQWWSESVWLTTTTMSGAIRTHTGTHPEFGIQFRIHGMLFCWISRSVFLFWHLFWAMGMTVKGSGFFNVRSPITAIIFYCYCCCCFVSNNS